MVYSQRIHSYYIFIKGPFPIYISMSYVTKFPDRNELKRFARYFVTDRINSLNKDVLHCLQAPFAPFPAILYCLSIIDLLGALTAGQGAKKEPSTGKPVDTTELSKHTCNVL
jgi:hypothetical protein